ncbi:MAG: hypothetical protein IJL20_03765 [Lachnospiraceae bacterium]|nr:hypothetical protein [Lachnospiraceae bacterium]
MKKLAAIFIIIGVLAFNSVPASAANHETPNGGICNNTWRHWQELNLVSHGSGIHYYGIDNLPCTAFYYTIGHNKICTSCLRVFIYNSVWQCTEDHKNCGLGFKKPCNSNFTE